MLCFSLFFGFCLIFFHISPHLFSYFTDSEYETESSSEGNDPSSPSKRGYNGMQNSKTPVSPVSRLSASKASFFSAAPTPVSLDPFSMFGLGKKGQEVLEETKTEDVETEDQGKKKAPLPDKKVSKESEKGKKRKKPPKKIISSPGNCVVSPDNRIISSSDCRSLPENVRAGSVSPKSTDISESLDADPKSPDLRSQRVAQTGSLAELREAFAADKWAEVDIDDQDEIFVPEEKAMEEQTEGQPGWEVQVEQKSRSPSVDSHSSLSAPSVTESKKPQSILKRPSVDLGVMKEDCGNKLLATETGSDDGDDERVEEEDEDEEMLEKTAVSKAMEQLLQDFDSKNAESHSIAERQVKNDTSDSGENEVFIEGRLSPSGLKTRKFRLKRQRRSSKVEQRRISKSGTSDSDAGRTDPTTTDNSQVRSSMSRSPSVEVQRDMTQPEASVEVQRDMTQPEASVEVQRDMTQPEASVEVQRDMTQPEASVEVQRDMTQPEASVEVQRDMTQPEASVEVQRDMTQPEASVEVQRDMTRPEASVEVQRDMTQPEASVGPQLTGEALDEAKTSDKINRVEENSEDQQPIEAKDTAAEESSAMTEGKDGPGTGLSEIAMDTGDDTLRHVLENVAAMPDLSDNSDIDDLVIANIDDKFVTNRRGSTKKKTKKLKAHKKKKKEDEAGTTFQAVDEVGLHSSFSISTPSGSDSESISSAVVDELTGQTLYVEPGEDDIKPDADMMKDYTTTVSLALGESFSDAEEIAEKDKILDLKVDALTPTTISKSQSDTMEKEISNCLCNSVNSEKVAGNESTATGSSSLYQTPDSSVNEPSNRSAGESAGNQRPLPKPNLAMAAPVPRPRTSLTSPISPTAITLPSPTVNTRDSSGSEVFVSPAENLPQAPFVNKILLPFSTDTSQSKSTTLPSSILYEAVTNTTTAAKPMPRKTSATLKSTSANTSLDMSSKKVVAVPEPVKKTQRKLPELPKLNVLSRQPLKAAGRLPQSQPVMCSSPKFANKQINGKPVSSAPENTVTSSRPLPIPKSTLSESRKSDIVSSKPPHPPVSSSSITKTPKTGKPTFSDAPSFRKPILKPVFKPPTKTKVPLDKTKLKLGSSSDKTESDVELDKKKKISADGIIIPKSPEDDIPFADESEAEDQFYTPCAPEKKAEPKFRISAENLQVHKRLLPNPPSMPNSAASSPGVLRANQIREIRQAEMEKAKVQARERARLKSDEELGLVGVRSGSSTPTRGILPQRQTLQGSPQLGHQCSASYDTASTSDVLSDSDDCRLREVSMALIEDMPETMNHDTPGNSADKKNKKKKKAKATKGRKVKKVTISSSC